MELLTTRSLTGHYLRRVQQYESHDEVSTAEHDSIALNTEPPPEQRVEDLYTEVSWKQTPTYSRIVVWILGFFLVLLTICLIVLIRKILHLRYHRYPGHRRDRKISQKRIDRRYDTVEHWLITKRVLAHDSFCDKVKTAYSAQVAKLAAEAVAKNGDVEGEINSNHETETVIKRVIVESAVSAAPEEPPTVRDGESTSEGDLTGSANIEEGPAIEDESAAEDLEKAGSCSCHSTSEQLEEDVDRECPICFNVMNIGDIVSWSPISQCRHVFHHGCLKEWLLRRTCCPICREKFLPIDTYTGKASKDRFKQMSKQHSAKQATTYYCYHEGLVQMPDEVKCNMREIQQLELRVVDCTMRPRELAAMRRSKAGGKRGMDMSGSHPSSQVSVSMEDINHTATGTSSSVAALPENAVTETGGYPATSVAQVDPKSSSIASQAPITQAETAVQPVVSGASDDASTRATTTTQADEEEGERQTKQKRSRSTKARTRSGETRTLPTTVVRLVPPFKYIKQ